MLQIKHLTFTHRQDLRVLLSDFSLVLNPGDRAVIIGEEGNGKSTLLKWIYDPALAEPYVEAEGERVWDGRMAWLPQELPEEERVLSVYEYFSAAEGFWNTEHRELLQLSRYLTLRAGDERLSDEQRLCTGEVLLNRVASPEFPDTLREVVYQRGQYTVVNSARFSTLVPRRECVDCALRLLQGERHMPAAVVYQADYLQGELFSMFYDRRLGYTYFCLSNRTELYG